MIHFGKFLKTWSLRSNSVTRQVSFNRTKIGGKCQNSKIQMRHFESFSNNVNLFGHPVLPLQLWYPKRLDMSHYSILHPLKILRFFYWLYSSSARIRGHCELRYGCLAGPSIPQPLQPHPRWMPSFGIFDARTYIRTELLSFFRWWGLKKTFSLGTQTTPL